MSAAKGRFVWYDVATTDVEASKAFYTEVIGWNTRQWGGPEEYTMMCVGERPIGGFMTLPEEDKQMGAPPHWIAYTAVPDVAATAAQAERLGGRILKGATEIPEVGSFAVLADPQGAVFAVFAVFATRDEMPTPAGGPVPGDFTWHELNTTDYEAAWSFYSALFGWQPTQAMDMGEEHGGTYFMYNCPGDEASMGGMSNIAKAMNVPPHWLYYVSVDDIDAALARITARGGQVLNGPMEVPGGDKVAQCMDPQGVAFAIHWRND